MLKTKKKASKSQISLKCIKSGFNFMLFTEKITYKDDRVKYGYV
jgi:hypothetical protein